MFAPKNNPASSGASANCSCIWPLGFLSYVNTEIFLQPHPSPLVRYTEISFEPECISTSYSYNPSWLLSYIPSGWPPPLAAPNVVKFGDNSQFLFDHSPEDDLLFTNFREWPE